MRLPYLTATVVSLGLTLATTALACTGIRLTAKDGSVIHARTAEFGAPLNLRLIVIPRGTTYKGGPVEGAKPAAWRSKYGVVGGNAHGAPLVLDGLNEKGLSAAAFYFPTIADYSDVSKSDDGKVIHPLSFVTYILTNFATIDEVRGALSGIKISGAKLKEWGGIVPPFHWIVHEPSGKSIVIEPVKGKLVVHDNPLGVITNSPSFDWHMTNLRNFIHLSPLNVPSVKIKNLEFKQLGQGSGLAGLPGDFTPPSRFVRAAVFSQTLFPVKTGREAVLEAFHVLNQFDIPRGAAAGIHEGRREADITQATIAADLKALKYYAHTYGSRRIQMIDLKKVDFSAGKIVQIDLPKDEDVIELTPVKKQ